MLGVWVSSRCLSCPATSPTTTFICVIRDNRRATLEDANKHASHPQSPSLTLLSSTINFTFSYTRCSRYLYLGQLKHTAIFIPPSTPRTRIRDRRSERNITSQKANCERRRPHQDSCRYLRGRFSSSVTASFSTSSPRRAVIAAAVALSEARPLVATGDKTREKEYPGWYSA